MSSHQRLALPLLPTGVPGLDEVLGGGLPEFSFNIIAGTPGAGKTTLAHQIMFANASAARPALYFTVMGEPAIKMLRYQQQLTFFDLAKIGESIRFIDLTQLVLEQELGAVLDAHRQGGRGDQPADRRGGFVPAAVRAARTAEAGTSGSAELHPTPGAAPDASGRPRRS